MSDFQDFQERYRRNDPQLNQICWETASLGSCQWLLEALENNTIVDDIFVFFCPRFVLDVDHFPLVLQLIQTRSQLCNFSVIESNLLDDHNMLHDSSPILMAAAQNPALQYLLLSGSSVVSPPASLGMFCSHPNLQELHLIMPSELWNQTNCEKIQEIVETCPRMNTLSISSGNFSHDNWKPICQALSTVTPNVNLELSFCTFDEKAMYLLRNFLHECPSNINLCVHPDDVKFPEDEIVLCLMKIVGPSVTKLVLKMNYLLLETQNTIMSFCKMHDKGMMLKGIEMHFRHSERCSEILFSEMPELIFLKKIHFQVHPRFLANHLEVLHFKTRLMDALNQNYSAQDILVARGWTKDEIEWTDSERAKLQYYKQRNRCLSPLILGANKEISLPVCVLPYVFQSCTPNHVGATIIFSILRSGTICDGLSFNLDD